MRPENIFSRDKRNHPVIICLKCKKEMRCIKNGIGADFGGGHVYASDKWGCDKCGAEVLRTNENAHYDPEYKNHDHYVKMKDTE
jgi:hypothetical protein